MEKTKVQLRIIKTYEQMAQLKTIYPTFTALALKAKVSRRYAHQVITAWKKQNKLFGLKEKV